MNPSSEHALTGEPVSTDPFHVAISDEQDFVRIGHDRLRQITRSVLQEEGVGAAQISLALVDDPTIHDVNRQFLGHDHPTDVISFLLSAPPPEVVPGVDLSEDEWLCDPRVEFDGEVIISAETARRTAAEIGCPPAHELALYLVHGLLHLCGFDDQTEDDRRRMRQREQSHLQKSGIPANYEC